MFEIVIVIALLLPVAWVLGYFSGKKRSSKKSKSNQSGFSKKYFIGLNYLLNEESDKAIDAFISMLEIDSETVETHLALGNLFRKRGEVDRAIRIHQNLIARPSLTNSHRKMSLLELGYDYMAAGLLDRAENIFKELVLDSSHKQKSLKQLLVIYQQTKDWSKAIAVAEKIQVDARSNLNTEIAHFYCELAENMLFVERQPKTATSYVKKALAADSSSARAMLINGEILYSLGKYKQAIKNYRELVKTDLEILPEAILKIEICFKHLNDPKGFAIFLQNAIEQGAGISCILAYSEQIKLAKGDRAAAEYIAMQMATHPSLKGLLSLIELHLVHASESAKPSLQMLHQVVNKLLDNKPVYHCGSCGFDAKTLFWQCPSCKNWGSVKPIQGIEGE
ncbi:lipopolysaccharide assembly protein LapB [Aliikangiella sp. IMCC44653]